MTQVANDYSPYAPYELSPDYENLAGGNRYERALIILRGDKNIKQMNKNEWVVKSQFNSSKYTVTRNGNEYSCNCPDCILHKNECKHILAVKMYLDARATVPAKSKYERDWNSYNQGMCDEFKLFSQYLKELVSMVKLPEQTQKIGRPALPIQDLIYAAVTKVALQLSSRRGQGVINSESIGAYNYDATQKFLRSPESREILRNILKASARPLKELEDTFSVDSSGFNTRTYLTSWKDEKYGTKPKRTFVKCHIICGNRTNVVADAIVTESNVADTKEFIPLVNSIKGEFEMKRVLADSGYLSRANYGIFDEMPNTDAIIMFKSNSEDYENCPTWHNAYTMFKYEKNKYYREYFKRRNVESAFGSIKDKYGETLKAAKFPAQESELYCKLIAYNISVLVKLAHGVF